MKCFYHRTDLDGHCSGAVVKLMYPECEMIGVDYSDSLLQMVNSDIVDLQSGETFFVVDFSFPRNDMQWLKDVGELIWIDHHKSALEKMEGFESKGVQMVGKAGCELTWEYLFPDKPMPKAVELLGRYDVWDHENPEVLPFQYGVRSFENTLPDSPEWEKIMFNTGPIIRKGQVILEYQQQQDEVYAKAMSFNAEFEGKKAIVVNKAYCNSKIFDSVYSPDEHDLMIAFGFKEDSYKYTLYSAKDDLDVSVLAMKYGGGGHKGAAGFYSKQNIFQQ